MTCSLTSPSTAVGDMLRAAVKNQTPVGLEAKGYMDEVRGYSTDLQQSALQLFRRPCIEVLTNM